MHSKALPGARVGRAVAGRGLVWDSGQKRKGKVGMGNEDVRQLVLTGVGLERGTGPCTARPYRRQGLDEIGRMIGGWLKTLPKTYKKSAALRRRRRVEGKRIKD